MAFVKVSGSKKYFKYSECKKGDVLVSGGTYLGVEEGKFGIEHNYKLPSGEIVVLNSAGKLNYLMSRFAAAGTICNVIYGGKIVLQKGDFKGKESHDFDLEVENGLMAGSASATPAKPAAPSLDDDITL